MPASYSKPTSIPRWADTSLNITEPSSGKKDEGWLFEEIPPSSWENWRTNLIGNWFKWVDERFADGIDENEFVIKDPSSQNTLVRFSSDLINVDYPIHGDSQVDLHVGIATVFRASAAYLQSYFPHRFMDTDFRAEMSAGKPTLVFDTGPDSIDYDRAGNRWSFKQLGVEVFAVGANGAEFGDPNFYLQYASIPGTTSIFFDVGDRLYYTRGTNTLALAVGGADVAWFDSTGSIFTEGVSLHLDYSGTGGALWFHQTHSIVGGTDLDFYSNAAMDIVANNGLLFIHSDNGQIYLRSSGTGSTSGNDKQIEMTNELVIFRDGPGGYNNWVFDHNDFGGGAPCQFSQLAGVLRLARSGGFVGHVQADFIHGHYDSDDPGGVANLNTVVARNRILASVRLDMNGAANPTLATYHWNVSSVTRNGVGDFSINLYDTIAATPVVHVSVAYTSPANHDKRNNAYGYYLNSSTIKLYTFQDDNPVDLLSGDVVYVTVVGRPSTNAAP